MRDCQIIYTVTPNAWYVTCYYKHIIHSSIKTFKLTIIDANNKQNKFQQT